MENEISNKDLQDEVSSHQADDAARKSEREQQQTRLKRVLEVGNLKSDDFNQNLSSYYEGADLDQLRRLAQQQIDDRTISNEPTPTNDKETK
jgi:hypothetical protein